MWPKGAAQALREAIAEHVRVVQRLVDMTFGALVDRVDPIVVVGARADALDVRHRADEAMGAYLGERGAKRVPPETWGTLARTPILMRLAADAVIALERAQYRAVDSVAAVAALDAALDRVRASFLEFADRLEDPARAADAALRAVVADLDMIAGVGGRTEDVLRETVAYVDAHRDDPATPRNAMAIVWGIGWLGYLAHVRMQAEPALDEVVRDAATPWWK